MSAHFVKQCLERNNGVLNPVQKRTIKEMIKGGNILVKKAKKGRLKLTVLSTGKKLIVSKRKMAGITFMD